MDKTKYEKIIENGFDNFIDFKQRVLTIQSLSNPDEVTVAEWYENNWTSKAALGLIDTETFRKNEQLTVQDLARGIKCLSNDYKQAFWSELAGNFTDPEDVNELISLAKMNFNIESYNALIFLPFALKSPLAWEAFHKDLMEMSLEPDKTMLAFSKVATIDEKFMPLLIGNLGKDLAKIYCEHKEIIDKTPRKDILCEMLKPDYSARADFLDAFTDQLKMLSEEKYEENKDDYFCLSNAIEKEGFKEDAVELFEQMLGEKEKYITGKKNESNNYFVKKLFPQLAPRIEEELSPREVTAEEVKKLSDHCRRCVKTAQMIYNRPDIKENHDDRLISDIIKQAPDNIQQVEKIIELFKKMNKRPNVYGSSYNEFYPDSLAPALKINMPEWMYEVIPSAILSDVVSSERLGSVKNLFDACKTWKINPRIWKKEAIAIGKMPLEARIVAGVLADKINRDNNHENSWNKNKGLREKFWVEMKKAQDMGWQKAMLTYCKDDAETRGRILSLYHPEIDEDLNYSLRSCVHFKDLIDFDLHKFNQHLDLLEKNCQIKLEDLLLQDRKEETSYSNQDKKAILRQLSVLGKVFASEELLEKFLKQVASGNSYEVRKVFDWVPTRLNQEKYASFSKFLSKNLFYDDGTGNMVIRSLTDLKAIGRIWDILTPQQEEQDFSKLLGRYYTYESEKQIEKKFGLCVRRNKNVQIPSNLGLYQKFLINVANPKNQDKVNTLLTLDRKEGLASIARIINRMEDYDKRPLVDLVIGHDANISDNERQELANFPADIILGFKPKNYQKILNMMMEKLANDPAASDLFRKHYWEVVGETTNSTNAKVLELRNQFHINKDWIVPSALKVMLTFGEDYQRYFNKINKYNTIVNKMLEKGSDQVTKDNIINLHDALYWLPDNLSEQNRKDYIEFIDKQLFYTDNQGILKHRSFNEMEIISKTWKNLSDQEKGKPFSELLAVIRAKKYADAKHIAFAEEAAKWGVPTCNYKKLENIFEQGLEVSPLIDTDKRFKRENLTGRFLPRDDPRTGFFGMHTDCCQHFNGAGSSCAISSVRDPFSQLFVVENEKGDIVAGSWVWESKIKKDDQYYKAFCFDNIEAIGDYKNSVKVMQIYKDTLPFLASKNYNKITVGLGYQDAVVDEFAEEKNPIPLNKDYSGYTDAHSQKLMLNNPAATPVDENEGDIYIVGAQEVHLSDMRKVSRKCFPAGDGELQVPEQDPQGLVLKDRGRVVGYALWSEQEHSIYDMAVLPEYRKDKNFSSLKLLNAVVKKIKAIGGEWTAELRDNTSLRYMKLMSERGLINLSVGDIDHIMSDGTKVYQAKFSLQENKNAGAHVASNARVAYADGR